MSPKFYKNFDGNSNGLPDVEECQAKETVEGKGCELVDCLVESPFCKHYLAFGNRRLCRHPRRAEIVERTNALAE